MKHAGSTIGGLLLAAALLAGAVSCSSDDASEEKADGTSTTTTTEATTDDTEAASDDAASDEVDACPEETVLSGYDVEGNVIELEAVVAAADVLDLSPPQSATFSFTNYDVDTEELRGVYQPTMEAGQTYFSISVAATAEFVPGTYTDQVEDPTATDIVNFTSLYTEGGRQLPTAYHSVEITEVTDTFVCGTISASEPGVSPEAYVEGSFKADRIDA